MNLRQAKPEEVPPPLQSYYDEDGRPRYAENWGLFGYEGTCADMAISGDSPEALKWLIDGGALDKDCKTLLNDTLLAYCRKQGKHQCAALLEALGYPA